MRSVNSLDNPLANTGQQRTDLYCHNCSKYFIGLLDYDIDGQHEIKCPHCRHTHYRKIEGGVITGERYDSDSGMQTIVVGERHVWVAAEAAISTSSAAEFLRRRWLNHGHD
jgi:DNA-directed RNA polymerase subunit RPC12/RpoP